MGNASGIENFLYDFYLSCMLRDFSFPVQHVSVLGVGIQQNIVVNEGGPPMAAASSSFHSVK